MAAKIFRAAILGASGYTGAELVRLLSLHPRFDIAALSADRKAGMSLAEAFPHLAHLKLPAMVKIDEIDFPAIDMVFCALPHATTQEVLKGLPDSVKIVDLSADFRLEDPAKYKEWYGHEHAAVELQKTAVYGLPEFYRKEIKSARLVANTGCYVATSLIPLIPLLRKRKIAADDIIIDAKSGVSGAGRAAKENMLFCEVSEGFAAYGVGKHRHMAEIDQELSKAAKKGVIASFTPHLVPQNRGILATIYVKGDPKAIHETLSAQFAKEYFVSVLPFGEVPQSRHVRGSNFVKIGVAADRRPNRAIIVSTLDNLVKGASGQAIQNANLMLGLPETMGLTQAPLFP